MILTGRFTLLIDESGEAGIRTVRSNSLRGASPYMTLGASLIRNSSRPSIEKSLEKISNAFGKKSLHCSQLNHYQLLNFIREIPKKDMRLFGVISHKATLGTYKSEISNDSSMYYNKCVQFLLERVGWFMESRGIQADKLDIVFEEANVDYDKMRNLLRKCQNNPKHPFTKKLQCIHVGHIQTKKKNEEPLLQLADLVAHALYKCVDKNDKNYGIPEPRYLRELAPYFFGNPDSQEEIVGAGLYCVHTTRALKLDADVEELLATLVANPP